MTTTELQFESYLYLHGLAVPHVVRLADNLTLHPISTPPSPEVAIEMSLGMDETALLVLFLPRVTSEFRITADSPESLIRMVWNAQWDALLLSALFGAQVETNIHSAGSATVLTSQTSLHVTNMYAHGLRAQTRMLSESECEWLEINFLGARNLLSNDSFNSSIHCLASYYWHPHPRARLALIWAGIEGLFAINSELSFRLSLYIAKFLEPSNKEEATKIFKSVKQLYAYRSTAVHGGTLRGKEKEIVEHSADLLRRLIRQCVANNKLPDIDALTI